MDGLKPPEVAASAEASTSAFYANADTSSSDMKCKHFATRETSGQDPWIEEKIPESPIMGSTTCLSQDENRDTSYVPCLMLSENFYDSRGTLTNQQTTCWEMDRSRVLQHATSHSEKHTELPARSTPGDLSWTSLNNITSSRYPSNLDVKIKRVDANVNAHYTGTRNESEILADNTPFVGRDLSVPNKESLKMSDVYDEDIEHSRNSTLLNLNKTFIDHQVSCEGSYIRSNNVHVERVVVQSSKNIYGEASRIKPTEQNDIHQKFKSILTKVPRNSKESKEMSVEQLQSMDLLTNKDAVSSSCTSISEENFNTTPESKDPELFSEHCSYRAARGCAVHPRSIAERVRRSRIAERVKILEAKLPYPTKKKGKRTLHTDEILERTVNYIKWLEECIKMLQSEIS
ncbi:protein MpBHLH18 [Marchantia polymorpha subsp. ruderalis]|uniref:BHLH domain-containing protein n=2 Tax=Marchantia polymorpha TaxID=3197 RepID=A0A176WB51_MARPO|nr:hypothetical protein AXG93_4003s1350 [Marchantia polymorpha subsp. ruderalis]PTQ45057.1 hypothetical protein MARPO_0016s0110 [Marchantia polymorpha]BBN14323.1 hypothetical protein Mp_6g10690 [Marchantia polymorpha subsp. ruderalis]|eukprot:PTQ45057.1 hypothetical protein MARPO_0016s0110 [Marchantia polymorpha]